MCAASAPCPWRCGALAGSALRTVHRNPPSPARDSRDPRRAVATLPAPPARCRVPYVPRAGARRSPDRFSDF
eukprot:scaffold120522_cov69-Phaeocystis_antarctica.AAC.5